MNELTLSGKSFAIAIHSDAINKQGNGLCRIKDYAKRFGIVLKKDEPGYDRDKAKQLRADFNVHVAKYRADIRPVGALIAADPEWELRSAKPSTKGTSMTLRYVRRTASNPEVKALLSEIAELKAKLAARDV